MFLFLFGGNNLKTERERNRTKKNINYIKKGVQISFINYYAISSTTTTART